MGGFGPAGLQTAHGPKDLRAGTTTSQVDCYPRIQARPKLDSLREDTQRLESVYERKLGALEALKKSLLHQAFSGEL